MENMLNNSLQINPNYVRKGDSIKSSSCCNSIDNTRQEDYSSDKLSFASWFPFYSASSKIQEPEDKKMYKELYGFLDKEGKTNLDNLLKTGKLLSKNSNDGSSTLQNLYAIMIQPRAEGLDSQKIITETLRTLANPFIITQNFGQIPDFMVPGILAGEKFNSLTKGIGLSNNLAPHFMQTKYTGPVAASNPDDLNVVSSGTCVAASIEFNLADKKPAEYARYVAGLTSPDVAVKTRVKFQDIAPSMIDAVDLISKFGVENKELDWENIELTVRPDRNAIIRARVQSTCQKPGSRSSIDSLMQSTFMELGSANSYNSLTDKRFGGFNPNEKGLTEFEKNFAEAIVDNNGGKTSITYQIVDENACLKGYALDFETTQKHLLDSLNSGSNVIIGITEVDGTNKIIGGHEITVIGTRTDKKGELYFICNDTDDNYTGSIEIKAKDVIPKIHHAGILNKVLPPANQPEVGYILLNEYQSMINQTAQNPWNMPAVQASSPAV